MKKILTTLSVLILVVSCACSPNEPQNEETTATQAVTDSVNAEAPYDTYLNQIYLVMDESYSESTAEDVHVISSIPVSSMEEGLPQTKELVLHGQTIQLTYRGTRHVELGSYKYHAYTVNGDERYSILFNEDGSIRALLYYFTTIDIAPDATPDTVRALLEPILEAYVDISKYEVAEEPNIDLDRDGSFGRYYFYYYNRVDGYIADFTRVAVDDAGRVYGLAINDLSMDVPQFTIDKEKVNTLIDLKLQKLFEASDSQYVSFDLGVNRPSIRIYNGELNIYYYVKAQLQKNGHPDQRSMELLIPLRLLTTEPLPEIDTSADTESDATVETQSVAEIVTEAGT